LTDWIVTDWIVTDWIDMQPGVRRRTLAVGESLMQMVVTLAAGSSLAAHAHQNEQMAHVVSGRLILTMDGIPHECGPGETVVVAGGIPHSAEALENMVVLDTFSPPRFDLLTQDEQHRKEQQDTHA